MSQAKIKCIEIPSEIVTIISIFIIPDENMLRLNFPFVFFNNFEFSGRCSVCSVIFGFMESCAKNAKILRGFFEKCFLEYFLKN